MDLENIKQKLIDSNKNVSNTMNEDFLKKFYNILPYDVLEYIVNFDKVQDTLLKLTDTQIDIFLKILDKALKNNDDWITILSDYVDVICWPDHYKHYSILFASLEGKSLDDKAINNLLFVIQNKWNFFNINSYSELLSFDDIKKNFNNKNTSKDAHVILLHKYGITSDTANNYLNRYGQSLDNLPECKEKEFLIDIKNIINGKGTDTLEFYDYEFINNIDSNFRKMFSAIYNERLFKVNEANFIGEVDYNGMNYPIYDAGTEFFMSIYSFGLATDYEEPENFYNAWNRPDSKVPNFCNSIINRKSMKTSIKHCVFGFDNFGETDIKLMGANDLGTNSHELNSTPNITSKYKSNESTLISQVEFRTPDDLINNTRYTNNEIYRSRRVSVDGKLEKINPSYIVYFKSTSDFDVTSDHIWQETLKAAYQFGKGKPIPIVIVDCEKCYKKDIDELESMIESFESSYDDKKILCNIVELIQTLSFGFCDNLALMNKYNSHQYFVNIINRVFNHISKISEMLPNTSIEMLDLLIDTLDNEYAKQNKSKYWIEKTTGKEEVERNNEIDDFIIQLKNQIVNKVHKNFSSNTLK